MDPLRFFVYEEGLYDFSEDVLDTIEKEALESEVPIIRKDTQGYLRFLLEALKPKNILEVGTAVGFSAILFARHTDAKIITMENYEPRIPVAKENFKRAGVEDRIRLIEGDAAESLNNIEGDFDFIFIDAAKGQYGVYLEKIMPHVHPGSVIVCDNILFDGNILESKYAVERRDRTIHKRLRDFIYDMCHDERFTTAILSVGDGLLLSVVK
jgi:predicted O-methyltransferase YrrM